MPHKKRKLNFFLKVSGVTIETPSIRYMRPHVNDFRGNTSIYLPSTVLSGVPPWREEEKKIVERACSGLEVNKFIRDKLQPDEIFHRLFNDAIDSLYRELQRDLQCTNYGIHNLIKVSDKTATNTPNPLPPKHTHTTEKELGDG